MKIKKLIASLFVIIAFINVHINASAAEYDLEGINKEATELYESVLDTEEYSSITLQGKVQDNLANGFLTLTYAIYPVDCTSDPEEEPYPIKVGYLYPSTNYHTQIALPSNLSYTVEISPFLHDKKIYKPYSYYQYQEIYMDRAIYYDFLYGDEEYIKSNLYKLSGGKKFSDENALKTSLGYDENASLEFNYEECTDSKPDDKSKAKLSGRLRILFTSAGISIFVVLFFFLYKKLLKYLNSI